MQLNLNESFNLSKLTLMEDVFIGMSDKHAIMCKKFQNKPIPT